MREFLKKHIKEDLKKNPLKGAHGIDSENIDEFLIEPKLEEYIGSSNRNDIFEVWTVLQENPSERSGYTIFYDPEDKGFGLGLYTSDDQLMHLGFYGSFTKTLNSM
ncbi:MAG: hypothetical protein CL667_09575 [Balneola sp.]|jgi:hypothetical protein|nr:hypothetical protein [Balneola sp.]HAD49933.1 hypothetical protein [Algoriphagus sp.]|tara:strand:+ start:472 stop:789 length:318 start_codon:yes stop_codon:yes gene_type:complete